MDFLSLIRLFKRNIILLLGIPFLLAVVVYYFTRHQEKVYESEAIIYTGITTGYSIESTSQRPTDYFSTSAQFDNMINLITSRQTVVETSLRLLGQDLSLTHYIPQYISNENFNKLQRMIPKRIKDLVVVDNKSGVEREKAEQINNLQKEIQSLQKQINIKKNQASRDENNLSANNNPQPVDNNYSTGLEKSGSGNGTIVHTVMPGESLASIASRYGVSRGELMSLNNLSSGDLTAGQRLVIKGSAETVSGFQYHVVQPGESLYSIAKSYGVNISKLREINNLNSGDVKPGQRIIISTGQQSQYGQSSYDYAGKQVSPDDGTGVQSSATGENGNVVTVSDELSNQQHSKPSGIFVKDPIVPPGVNPSDYEKTVNNLQAYYASDDTNYIYGLLQYGSNAHYSISYISKVQIFRVSNSDLVKLTYTSDDPGICQQTLKIISTVFMRNYRMLRINETDRVVEYFQHQVDSADRKLNEAEDRLLRFNKQNNIINYYEQSKAIALQKEDLDKYYQDQQIRLSGASLTLQEIETKMTARDSIYLKSDEINQMRKQLSDVSEKIIVNRLAESYNSDVAARLQGLEKKQKQLRANLKLRVDELYLYGHSTQGVSIKNLLDAWLANTITYTEAKAALIVLARRKLDFIRTYQKMAPLGAMLTRIEREIKVNEQTYLELLHSLNQAKMKQQNLELSTNIKVVDPPYFPISPNPSRAKYIVLAAGFAGFIIIAFLIIMLEYFDTSAKNPSRVVEQTGMELGGAFPYLFSRNFANELSQISARLIDMIIQNIKLNLASLKPEPEKPYLVLLFSTQNGVGKTLLAHKIINQMRSMGNKVLFLNYSAEDSELEEEEDFNHSFHYTVKSNFIDVSDLQELMDSRYLRKNNTPYDFIFIEIPSIVYHTYPIKLLSQVDLSLFVVRSSNKFTRADKTALKTFREAAPNNFLVVLNEVELYNLDELLTEIPKNRTGWMNRIKAAYLNATKYKITVKREVKNRG
ncbi:MAG: LysM peptidoglycan-binding domain-containing protein [Bacteroidales bacterium]|nr:LysM peptidoglycan-binding domain-containing protein [Bacteroidales bacterium]